MKKTSHNENIVAVSRDLSANLTDLPQEQLLTIEERQEFFLSRNFPILYDIFLREYEGGQQIVAMGPWAFPTDFIGLPEIWHDGKKLTVHSWKLGGMLMYIINSHENVQFKPSDTLELQWMQYPLSFKHTVRLQAYPWLNDTPKLTLNTLQKDNPLEWIRDWILYHHRTHGVERILLYDNVSQNIQELAEFLPTLESEQLEICLIHWDIEYEPRAMSLCQEGSLAHAYYWPWDKTSWDINCDIDEYLVNPTRLSLLTYLKRYTNYFNPLAYASCQYFLAYREEESNTPLVTDFKWKLPRNLSQGKKILSGGHSNMVEITVHGAKFSPNMHSYLLTTVQRIFKKDLNLIPSQIKQRNQSCLRLLMVFYKVWSAHSKKIALTMVAMSIVRVLKRILGKSATTNGLCEMGKYSLHLYHYRGLNQNWKHKFSNTPPDESCHQDTEILELLKKARVGKYYSQ